MRTVRDRSDHWLPVLGPAATCDCSSLSLLIRAGAALQLGPQLRSGLPDPLGASGPSPRPAGDTIGADVAGGSRGHVFCLISVLGLGDDAGHAPVEPVLATVGVNRGVRGDLGPIDRYRADLPKPASAATINI